MSDQTYTDYWHGLDIAIARLENEPPDAYQAFLCFASLRGKQRSADRVAKLLGYSPISTKYWQHHHKWTDRVSAVDAQVWIKEQQQRDQITKAENEKFAKENAEIRTKALGITKKMLHVAENLLESADLAGKIVETGHVTTQDGREVPTHTEIHMKSKVSDIPRLVDSAIKNSRLVNELPTDIVDRRLPTGSELGKLSDEALEAMRDDNREILVRHGVLPENEQVN